MSQESHHSTGESEENPYLASRLEARSVQQVRSGTRGMFMALLPTGAMIVVSEAAVLGAYLHGDLPRWGVPIVSSMILSAGAMLTLATGLHHMSKLARAVLEKSERAKEAIEGESVEHESEE